MPLTIPAHQVPVLPLKLWRPRWFDGTALVVASAAPDLQQAAPWVPFPSHHAAGVILFCLPFTVMYCTILRRWAADGLFGSLPDLGPLRLKDYRVLGARRPALVSTVGSALLGAGAHVFVDSFTHRDRWGSNTLGLNTVWFELPNGEFTTARLIQYTGHTVGSLIGIALFVLVTSGGRLASWYGPDVVERARNGPTKPRSGVRTLVVVGVTMLGAAWWYAAQGHGRLFIAGCGVAVGLLLAGIANRPNEAMLDSSPPS